MKLGTLRNGRDGTLVVVHRDLSCAAPVQAIAPTLQAALDDWDRCRPALQTAYESLCRGTLVGARPLDTRALAAPLPRAYQWADASAYVRHVELVRRARGADMPDSFWTDPLLYQGGSDHFLAANDDIEAASEEQGIDLEAEIAVITRDVPRGASRDQASGCIALLVLVNDVSLRNLIPNELAKGFGFFQSKPASALSPVAVTPDELGQAWDGSRVHRPLEVWVRGEQLGAPDAGRDMTFGFPELLAHAALTRALGAGTILGSGTVSNADPAAGSACLAERRTLELLEHGKVETPFLHFGDQIRIEMLDAQGRSIFGAIDQRVVPYRPASAQDADEPPG